MSVPDSVTPLVTVLMPVYNVAPYVQETLDSILNQTFTDFEFLIYNDGSSDETATIIRRAAAIDSRIIFHDSATNIGYVPHLNKGLKEARGRYIARIDGDDLAHPERLARQVAYLEAHPAVGICGSIVQMFDAGHGLIDCPENDNEIRQTLCLENAFIHPATIIRTSVLREHDISYNVEYMPAEDYKMWCELSRVTQMHNLQEVLTQYRIHSHQISRQRSALQQQQIGSIRREQMAWQGIFLEPEYEAAFTLLATPDRWRMLTESDYQQIIHLLNVLSEKARAVDISPAVINQVLGRQWSRVLEAAGKYRLGMLPFALQTPWRNYRSTETTVKLALKCLIQWRPKIA